MALVHADNAVSLGIKTLKTDEHLNGVQVLSYKRNRSITIIKTVPTGYLVSEDGYLVESRTVKPSQLSRHLKTIFKREFPRSRKLRLIKLQAGSHGRNDLKKL